MNRKISKGNSSSMPAGKIDEDVLFYAIADSKLGKVLVASSKRGVCSILLGDKTADLSKDIKDRFPQSTLIQNETALKGDIAKILRFLEEPRERLQLRLDMRGTPFQRRVWEKMRAIPAGRTVSYSELARWLNPIANPRAVARACAANPIALAVPCHRVIRSDDSLAGYRWGIDRKRSLLQKEAAN